MSAERLLPNMSVDGLEGRYVRNEARISEYSFWAENQGVHSKLGKFYFEKAHLLRVENALKIAALIHYEVVNHELLPGGHDPFRNLMRFISQQTGTDVSDFTVIHMVQEYIPLVRHYHMGDYSLRTIIQEAVTLFLVQWGPRHQHPFDRISPATSESEMEPELGMLNHLAEIGIGEGTAYSSEVLHISKPNKKGLKKLLIDTKLLPLPSLAQIEAPSLEISASQISELALIDEAKAQMVLATIRNWEAESGLKLRKDGVIFPL